MEEFSPLLILLFFWIVIGLPVSMAKKANQRQAVRRIQQQPAPPAEAPAASPAPAEPERLTPIRPTLSEPDHDDSVFTGSLGALATEGYDPCHEEQLSGMEPVCLPGREEAPAAEVPGIALGWTANDVVRGIVMSEILNRKR